MVFVAYQKPDTGAKVYVDAFRVFVQNGVNELYLWQEEALELSNVAMLETLQVQPGGLLMWLSGSGAAYSRVFCSSNEVFYEGYCIACPAQQGTLFMQQTQCMTCYDILRGNFGQEIIVY